MNQLLYFHWHVNPVLFHIGGLELRWYSLLFVGGFILGLEIFRKFLKREGIKEDFLDPLLWTALLATIVGARLGHVIFYQPDYYFGSWAGFLEIFMVWKGGLASHGGAIALLLGMWWLARKYGRKYDVDFLWIMDRLCITVAFAGCLIRLGNFFNSEIYGDVTNLPWGVVFDLRGETQPKHPTQLYEAFAYLVIGIVMLTTYKRRLSRIYRGFLFGLFMLACFGVRMIVEIIKEPQVDFEVGMTLDMGQWLSIPFVVAGIAMIILSSKWKIPAAAVHDKPVKKKQETHYAHGLNG